jgi:lysophospholipase L1-like esterase
MLVRFRQDVVELKPKVVVILAGTNDIAGNTGPSTVEMIQDNIASMAEIATANGLGDAQRAEWNASEAGVRRSPSERSRLSRHGAVD